MHFLAIKANTIRALIKFFFDTYYIPSMLEKNLKSLHYVSNKRIRADFFIKRKGSIYRKAITF